MLPASLIVSTLVASLWEPIVIVGVPVRSLLGLDPALVYGFGRCAALINIASTLCFLGASTLERAWCSHAYITFAATLALLVVGIFVVNGPFWPSPLLAVVLVALVGTMIWGLFVVRRHVPPGGASNAL